MPSTLIKAHKLRDPTIAFNKQMRGDLLLIDGCKIRMRFGV